MQDLLSQDEIDALMHGVTEGDVDTGFDDSALTEQYRTYDLASQDRVVRGRMPVLERINERFAGDLKLGFRGLLRRGLDVKYEGIQIQKFGEYFNSLFVPTSINLVRLRPLSGYGLIVLDSKLVFLLVDNFFGGGRFHVKVEGREFTPTEMIVTEKALSCIFEQMQNAWGGEEILQVELLQKEISPESTTIYSMNDIAVISSFSVEFDVSGGSLHIVIPYGMAEPIKEHIEKSSKPEGGDSDSRWEAALKQQIMDAGIGLNCVVANTKISLREVLDMEPGDIVPLNALNPVLHANDVPLFYVRLGRLKDNLALQVMSELSETERA